MNRSIPAAVFSTLTIQGQALPGDLAVRRLHGNEGTGRLFYYRVEVVAPHAESAPEFLMNPALELDQIRGTFATVAINLENIDLSAPILRGAGVREIGGLITEIRVLGVEKNAVVYEFTLRPSVWPATLRQNSRTWNGSILECIAELLRPYGSEIDWRIANESGPGANPARDLIRQAWETDWQFFMRLCEEFGYVVWFEHQNAKPVLVIADNANAYLKHDAPFETLPYRTSGGHIGSEHITEFVYSRTVTVGTVTVHDHSYLSPRQNPGSSPYLVEYSDVREESICHQDTYVPADFAQPQTRLDMPEAGEVWQDDARHLARVKLEAMRCTGHCARGSGALRGIQSGKTFRLTEYPHRAANRSWLVTYAELDICELPTTSGVAPSYTTRSTFEAVPVDEPYRLPQITPRPRIDGYEYAVIVSPDKREIWIDEHNRVLIQYLWDRESQYDGRKSIWVRLATPWQGEQMGIVAHARRGDAVLVSYINGDPDRPVIAAFVPDRDHKPPWSLPANQALSGMRSRSLEHRAQSNHVALDDTPGRLQAQIASDHGKSSISLGYNTRIDGNQGRQDARGEGIEARTDLWGVLRAGKGWLMTSFSRESASAKVKDMRETHSRLARARGIHEELALTARQHGAQDGTDNQEDVAKAIKEANAQLRGSGEGDFPELENPDIALSSAANVHVTAEQNVHIASSENTAVTTGGSVSIAAARSFFLSVRQTVSMFASKAITLLTPGPVRIVSRGDQLDLIAQKVINILSERDEIRLTAKRIVLNGSGTEMTLGEDGILGFTGGQFLVHAALHATDKAQTVAPVTYEDSVQYDQQFTFHDANGLVLANTYYTVKLPSDELRHGITDSQGRTERYETGGAQSIKFYMGHKREA
jgi:type VI secretion system secreted protein VgrG